jgi:Leucine-rich repeat (LRR) protein
MALKSLEVVRNKLVDFPLGLSILSNLQIIDVPNNRLTYLEPLKLFSLMTLRELNAHHNKIHGN